MTKAQLLRSLDKFTISYLDTILWSEHDESTPSGGYPLDKNYDLNDFTIDALNKAAKDCAKFQRQNRDDLDESGLTSDKAGYLFCLNRNGHGVGFWSEDLDDVGDRLSKASEKFGGISAQVDKGKINIY